MGKRKVLAALVIVALLSTAVTGCKSSSASSASSSSSASPDSASSSSASSSSGAAPAGAKSITIGFASTNLSNQFQVTMREAAIKEAKAKNVTLLNVDGQGDGAKQVSQIETFIAKKVNAIVMAPTDQNACAPAVKEAASAKIPMIVVNSTVTNMDEAAGYVGSNDEQAGQMEMQYIADKLSGKGNIVILQGPIGNSAEVGRTKGIKDILAKYPDIKVIGMQPGNWDTALAMTLTENFVQANKQIDAVVAENDEMALGAVKAVSEKQQSSIKIIGVDAIPGALKAVQSGTMVATVFQDAAAQGAQAVDEAIEAAQGQTIPKNHFIPFQLVTPDNVSKYLASNP